MNDFAFRPTHVAAQDGMPTWTAPDPSHPSARLDPLLPVQLLDREGDWGRIVCSNGWSAWVDGRLLISLPDDPPAAGLPPGRAADPRPLLAEAERVLGRHRELLEDLATGRSDLETFRRLCQGLRLGLVVDGDALWVFDPAHDRWCYCDGLQLQTYVTTDRPVDPVPDLVPESAPPAAPATPEAPAPAPGRAPGAVRPAGYEPTRAGEP
ncbi:hypothetical protein [Kitasatospora sp. NBC_00315]|uniref:hypothetical protein n=1 Tax=Kitasatospora sp. NBC_00315 TaxID=2975963 RepID=UPI00324B76B4